jgi:hypothetical protein
MPINISWSVMRAACWSALVAGLALLATTGVCAAQEIALPVAVHVPILLKILTFDRHLPARLQTELVIGIVYQRGFHASAAVAEATATLLAQLPDSFFNGFPIRAVPIALDDTPDLAAALTQDHVNALYIAPVSPANLDRVIRASKVAQISTLTGVPEYVEEGLAIGIDNVGDRPSIVVNVVESRKEGADLSAQVLKLARVLGR